MQVVAWHCRTASAIVIASSRRVLSTVFKLDDSVVYSVIGGEML